MMKVAYAFAFIFVASAFALDGYIDTDQILQNANIDLHHGMRCFDDRQCYGALTCVDSEGNAPTGFDYNSGRTLHTCQCPSGTHHDPQGNPRCQPGSTSTDATVQSSAGHLSAATLFLVAARLF